jgi:hypothetical protein
MIQLKIPVKYKEFLEEQGAFDCFVQNYKKSLDNLTVRKIENKIEKSNKASNFVDFISGAYIWKNTPEGHKYWQDILETYKLKYNENTIIL